MIYLDNAATTKPLFNAVKQSEKYLLCEYFNPSAKYKQGIETKKSIENARQIILKDLPPYFDVVFTSCGTESDNTAIFSFAKRGNVITTSGEHSAVYECFNQLKMRGIEVRFAKVLKDGRVDKEHLLSLVDDKTTFVSIVHVNNETGGINDVNDLSTAIKRKNPSVIFHSDGVQAFGKLPFSLSESVDLYSVSAHKIGGLKGVGALIKKKKLTLAPYIFGGGQENGLRSGTENVFGINVFAVAYNEKQANLRNDYEYVLSLKELFLSKLDKDVIKVISSEFCSPYILSLSAEGLRGEVIMHMMEEYGVIIGTGSACSSKNPHSRILKECGYGAKTLDGAIRISFSALNTKEEVEFAVEKLNECVKKLKGIMKK
ncbi:MAG: cysteine desulfurase [Clostridia bacterium]|nr:cysteine desulfurase [Clostridia bacterium]